MERVFVLIQEKDKILTKLREIVKDNYASIDDAVRIAVIVVPGAVIGWITILRPYDAGRRQRDEHGQEQPHEKN